MYMMDQSKKRLYSTISRGFCRYPPVPSGRYKYEWVLTWEMERLIDVDIKFGSELLPTPSGLDSVATWSTTVRQSKRSSLRYFGHYCRSSAYVSFSSICWRISSIGSLKKTRQFENWRIVFFVNWRILVICRDDWMADHNARNEHTVYPRMHFS